MFCEKGGGKIDTRKRITIRLPQDVYGDILDNLGNAASSTFNSFMTNAARFYLGYIKARETEDYLSKTLLSIISARQERSDKATRVGIVRAGGGTQHFAAHPCLAL